MDCSSQGTAQTNRQLSADDACAVVRGIARVHFCEARPFPERAGALEPAGINAFTTLALKRQLLALQFSTNANKPLAASSRDGRSPRLFQKSTTFLKSSGLLIVSAQELDST